MKWITRAGLLTLPVWLLTQPSDLVGWSNQGHRIVALAATDSLSDNAKRRMSYLLGKEGALVDSAEFVNALAASRVETHSWQSIAIPPGVDGLSLRRDCPIGDCVTAKIREFIGILRLSIRPRSELVEAFQMIVGLAGDMHQPLLNGYPPMHGKESNQVVLGGKKMSLFDAWESELIQHLGSEEEAVQLVRQRIDTVNSEEWKSGTLNDWTWETHMVAVEKVYPTVKDKGSTRIDPKPDGQAVTLLIDQLAKSAVRLAAILDDAWPR